MRAPTLLLLFLLSVPATADPGGELVALGSRGMRHNQRVGSVAVSPDGRWIASAGETEPRVQLWDARTAAPARRIDTGARAAAFAFSPDGALLAGGDGRGALRLWTVATGADRLLAEAAPSVDGRVDTIEAVDYGDGRVACGRRSGLVEVLDAVTGERLGGRVLRVRLTPVGCVGVAALDGSLVAGLVGEGETPSAAARLRQSRYGWERGSASISADGSKVALAGWQRLLIWDRATGRPWRSLDVNEVTASAFRDDGQALLVGTRRGQLQVWDLRRLAQTRVFGAHERRVSSVRWLAGDAQVLAAGDDRRLTVWDLATGRSRFRDDAHRGAVDAVAFLPDGRLLSGSTDQSAALWDVGRRARLARLAFPVGSGRTNLSPARGLAAISADGARLVTGDGDGYVAVWQRAKGGYGVARRFRGHRFSQAMDALALSPDGARLVVCSGSRVIGHDPATGERRWAAPARRGEQANTLAFRADGSRLVVAYSHHVALLDAARGEALGRFDASDCQSACWLGDDRLLVARSMQLELRKPSGELVEQLGERRLLRRAPLAATADGRRFAVGRGDVVELWSPDALDEARVRRLIEQLGADAWARREAASKALFAIGRRALRLLRARGVEHPDAEVRARAYRLVAELSRQPEVVRQPARVLRPGTGDVLSLAFDREGRLAIGTRSGIVHVWLPGEASK